MAGQYAPAPQSYMAIFRGPMNPSSITRATTPFFHVIAGLVWAPFDIVTVTAEQRGL